MRYNIFQTVHAPLKAALLSGCVTLTDAIADHNLVPFALRKTRDTLRIFEAQMLLENIHILPAVFEFEPSVWNNYNHDHQQMKRLAMIIDCLLNNFEAGDENGAIRQLHKHYDAFTLLNYNHMDEEEAVLNNILWTYYPDDYLKKMQRQMRELSDVLPADINVLTIAA